MWYYDNIMDWTEIQKYVEDEHQMGAKDYIVAKLRGGGTVAALAREFGQSRKTMYYRLARLGIQMQRVVVVLGEQE